MYLLSSAWYQVKEGFEQVSAELAQVKTALSTSQQREKQSGSLVQELTSMVKEQKSRIADLIKSKRDAVTELKVRIYALHFFLDYSSLSSWRSPNCFPTYACKVKKVFLFKERHFENNR